MVFGGGNISRLLVACRRRRVRIKRDICYTESHFPQGGILLVQEQSISRQMFYLSDGDNPPSN